MANMTNEEWQKLYEQFETYDLLTAVDRLDHVRAELADDEQLRPPELRIQLLHLHQLAMDVVNKIRVGQRKHGRCLT